MKNYSGGVSSDYPEIDQMIPFDIKLIHREWTLDRDFFESLVGADCWGIYIRRQNGELLSLVNTYALYDKVGRCFNKANPKYIPNLQYEQEEEFRDKVIDNMDTLINMLRIGDTASIMMYGNGSWRIDCKKISNTRFQYRAYSTPQTIEEFRSRIHRNYPRL